MNHLQLVPKNETPQIEATLALLAALSDHQITDAERYKISKQITHLSEEELKSLYHNVLVLKPTVEEVLEKIEDVTGKKKAYRIAMDVCMADGELQKSERYLLSKIRSWVENKPYTTLTKAQLLAPLKGLKNKFYLKSKETL